MTPRFPSIGHSRPDRESSIADAQGSTSQDAEIRTGIPYYGGPVENYPLTADDTDAYGFSALPSGVYIFGDHENAGFYLSSTLVGGDAVYDVGIVGNQDEAAESNALFTTAISARCVMD